MAYSNTCTVLLLVHNDLDNSDTPLKAIMEFRIPPSPDPAIDDSGKITSLVRSGERLDDTPRRTTLAGDSFNSNRLKLLKAWGCHTIALILQLIYVGLLVLV